MQAMLAQMQAQAHAAVLRAADELHDQHEEQLRLLQQAAQERLIEVGC